MKKTSRRRFLILSQQLLFGASAMAICPLTLRAADIENLGLKHLDSSNALLLAQVSRLLFPHNSLADAVYLDVVRDIDADMSASESTRALLGQASSILNQKTGGAWQTATLAQKLEALTLLQGSELFLYLQNRTIESLYRHPEVWKLIGYEGSSVEHGGYLLRGFDDIDWLPE